VIIEDPEGGLLLGQYDLDLTKLSKFAGINYQPAQNSFDKDLKDVDKQTAYQRGLLAI
jgi:hypothetical protein